MPSTLLLQLVGPMQSWGFRSRFDNRDTGLEPTRSGITGLLCAALGLGRDADLREFDSLKIGIRVDKAGTVQLDYQTAQPIWREGKNAGTTQSDRYYLADARFLVGLEHDDRAFLEKLENALKNPVWPLFLGRKSFPPSVPVHFPKSGIHEGNCLSVLKSQTWFYFSKKEKSQSEYLVKNLRLILEVPDPKDGVAAPVLPRDFQRRRYEIRYLQNTMCETSPPIERHPLFLKDQPK